MKCWQEKSDTLQVPPLHLDCNRQWLKASKCFMLLMMWKEGGGVKSVKIAQHERKEHYKVFAVTF
jgi:hypothetical protein